MGHNYAKPVTTATRLENILKRIPQDWSITLTREENTHNWQSFVHAPGVEAKPSAAHKDIADALQEGWKQNRS